MTHRPYKLGIVTTHPIQYQVPWFQRLAATAELDLTVFYAQVPDGAMQGDGFGVAFSWDIAMFEGYRYHVLQNKARRPSVTRFRGCDTPEIHRHVRDGGFDAFIVNGWVAKSCLQTLWACKRCKVPCIVRGESSVLRPRAWWKRTVHRWLVRQYAACLYIGESNAAFYRRHGVPEQRLFPARYFVDNERFARQAGMPGLREAARRRWEIPPDRVVFLYSGKLIPKKHPLELLHAFRSARQRTPRAHLLFVGDGELRAACEAFAADHRLGVTFAGFMNQTEIPAAYAASDCLVLPSDDGETWGLVVNEAMACGLPAIVSDRVGCGPDLVESGRTGSVFPFGDWRALEEILVAGAGDPDVLRRQGRSAKIKVADYCVDAAAEGTLEAVRFVTRRRGAHPFVAAECGR
jgi:glycosyltransferase involved in cell wall biosynthesis